MTRDFNQSVWRTQTLPLSNKKEALQYKKNLCLFNRGHSEGFVLNEFIIT